MHLKCGREKDPTNIVFFRGINAIGKGLSAKKGYLHGDEIKEVTKYQSDLRHANDTQMT